MGVRGIVLDIGGVLELSPDGTEPTATFAGVVARWEARLGLGHGALSAHLEAGRDGGLTGAYTYDAWTTGLRAFARMSDDEFGAFERDFWDAYLGTFNAELALRLRGWRGAYRTALLSNSFVGAREREQARYGMGDLVELIVYSHEVGMAKPSPRIYELTCERLGLAPADTIFLDDVPRYVEGARDAGMRAILYENNAQAIAAIEAML